MSCSMNRNNSGRNMHSQMKLCPYKLKIHPNSWHEVDMVRSFVDCMQEIQHHACHCAHACNPTHSTHSPRRRQEASPTGVEHVLQQVDAYEHQHTLEDEHGHYASVCCWFSHTQEDHVHVSGQFGWKSRTNAPVVTEARVRFSKMSPWGACTSPWRTKLGISSPPSPS